MTAWARTAATTIRKYIKGETDATIRNRKLLAILEDRGRITYNHSGTDVQWQVAYKDAPMVGFDDSDTISFARLNRWKNAVLPWRGYSASDQITKMEEEMNKGAEALIKVMSSMAMRLMKDVKKHAGLELYVDGNASGNSKRWHGIESFFSNSGADPDGYIGVNNDTYAGLSTALAGGGGTWTGNWPTGTGDAHYDFWTPLIVDYTDTAWSATTKTWPNTCIESLRYGIIKGKKNAAKEEMLDLNLMNDELFRQFQDRLQIEEHINVTKGGGSSGLLKLGFDDIVNFDGVDHTFEYGVPSGVAYGWAMGMVELMSLQSDLFVPQGPDFSIESQSHRFAIMHFGNLKFESIRNFVKWMSIT